MEIEEDDSMFEILADTVKLNIGGYKYEALKETLTKNESFFSLMINSPISSKTDSEGYIYIEQNGEVFKYILEYLKTGEITFYNHEEKLNFIKKSKNTIEIGATTSLFDFCFHGPFITFASSFGLLHIGIFYSIICVIHLLRINCS